MMRTAKIITNGTEYRQGSIILLACEDDFPLFGQVTKFFILRNMKVAVTMKMKTVSFDNQLNAYSVQKSVH